MTTANTYQTALQIVNEVQRRLGLNPTTNFEINKYARTLLDLLNDVMAEVSDFGDWPQMLKTIEITANSSVYAYEIAPASGNVKNVYEIAWGDQSSPMFPITIEEIRQRNRRISWGGTPREYAMVGVSAANPIFHIHPIPVTADISAQTSAGGFFDVLYYESPRILTTADSTAAAVVLFPARMMVQGLYAKALLRDNGGIPTPNYQAAFAEYQRMRSEALNRLTADTGSSISISPTGSRWG